MNPLLTIPRDIIFLLLRHLDICDITRLCQTSKEVAKIVVSRVQEVHYPEKHIWRQKKETSTCQEDSSRPMVSQRKLFYADMVSQRKLFYDDLVSSNNECGYEMAGHTFRIPPYSRPKVDHISSYSLALPPIYLLNQYPALTKCNVPFLGSVSDLLDVIPTSLKKFVDHSKQLRVICTYPDVPSEPIRSWGTRYWTPLPSEGKRSLYQRMKEWLVSFVLLYRDATLSLIIIPEKNLLQQNNNFELWYNSFHYANRHVQTCLPFTKCEPTEIDSDLTYSISLESKSGNTVIPVELWLNMLETVSPDNVEIEVTKYYFYFDRDVTDICSFLRNHFPTYIRRGMEFDGETYSMSESLTPGIGKTMSALYSHCIHESNLLHWTVKFHQAVNNRQHVARGVRLESREVMPTPGIPRNLDLLGVPNNVVKREKKIRQRSNFEQKRTQRKREKRIPLMQKNFYQKKYR